MIDLTVGRVRKMDSDYSKYEAKKTFYNGRMYDSALEAKVAEWLDTNGYEYKPKPMSCRGGAYIGGQYTPDFMVPDEYGQHVYIEVAGVWDERHRGNAAAFVHHMQTFDQSGCYIGIDGDGTVIRFTDVYGWPDELDLKNIGRHY